MKRALVLGGGGVAGVAWEGGMLAGLAEGGVPLDCTDVIVGTSSGAFMGMRLAAGIPPADIFPPNGLIDVIPPLHPLGLDLTVGPQAFELWKTAEEMDETRLAQIGALALRARTVTEAQAIARTGARIAIEDWPDRSIRVTAVDVVTGKRTVFDSNSGEPMQLCISASVALPVMMPPITVGTRRYMDGGVHSNSNADLLLADAPEAAVIVAPISELTAQSIGPLADRTLARECAALEAAGVRTVVLRPNEQDAAAFGTSVMDPTGIDASREHGYKRGLEYAAAVRAVWQT